MMAVRYHGCRCHLRHLSAQQQAAASATYSGSLHVLDPTREKRKEELNEEEEQEKSRSWQQPWYFHIVASVILVVHGLTFLVPSDPDSQDTDMVRTVAGWFGYEMDWVKHLTPYAQGLAAVFNIALGIVCWWTAKESERYTRLIQLRVFAFCINILHAYITGPIVFSYNEEERNVMVPGRIIGLFRLSYLTPGLMAAGVTEVIVEKEQEEDRLKEEGEQQQLESLGLRNQDNRRSKENRRRNELQQ